MKRPVIINELTSVVVNLCVKIHTRVGPGCFERVYEEILYYELTKLGYNVCRQIHLPLQYEELNIPNAYKLDMLVEDRLILELKSQYPLPMVFFNQIRTHLSFLNLKHGMLLNFKVPRMKDGIFRIYNNSGSE